jgi:hypothetical protein
VYANLDYFLIPFTRAWEDYYKEYKIENLGLIVYLQLQDWKLCRYENGYSSISIYNMTKTIETSTRGYSNTIRGDAVVMLLSYGGIESGLLS